MMIRLTTVKRRISFSLWVLWTRKTRKIRINSSFVFSVFSVFRFFFFLYSSAFESLWATILSENSPLWGDGGGFVIIIVSNRFCHFFRDKCAYIFSVPYHFPEHRACDVNLGRMDEVYVLGKCSFVNLGIFSWIDIYVVIGKNLLVMSPTWKSYPVVAAYYQGELMLWEVFLQSLQCFPSEGWAFKMKFVVACS